ncbi:hypothetical protein NQ314_003888 [Rhamnusium bicolor]|uniref:PiggyBac transposable element-derived protein domain-containing protein n=1 Tax=Rhamnusium bicolor TaxID=1586634 RepID=A0AAV8ZM15_9CUCU|nr:hypothetical protein NQ314_003888 [Rhamnusium bicolor]
MINEIVQQTNVKLNDVRLSHRKQNSPDYKDTDAIELKRFIGLLMLSSICKSGHENMLSLTMKLVVLHSEQLVILQKRFEKLLQCLQFDDKNTRDERREHDGTAAISFIFKKFVLNSQNCFNLGTAYVDKMLVGFRGKCKFRIYMPNKSVKYGIKILSLTDARNSYFYNGCIYTGKDSDGQTLSKNENKVQKPTQAVIRLAKPL